MNAFPIPDSMEILVTDHAMWQAAIRFRGFDTVQIEKEIRDAARAGRLSPERPACLHPKQHHDNLYAITPCGQRVYAIAVDREQARDRFVVRTTMRAAR